MMSLPVTLGDH